MLLENLAHLRDTKQKKHKKTKINRIAIIFRTTVSKKGLNKHYTCYYNHQ